MEPYPSSTGSHPRAEHGQWLRRVRVIGLSGAGACFLISQLGLLWVLAMGGIGSNPSIADSIWLFSALVAVLFLFLVADSYREHPRWVRERGETTSLTDETRDASDRTSAKVL
jgi:hypothetical protein